MSGGEESEYRKQACGDRRWLMVAALAVLAASALVALAAWPPSTVPGDSGVSGLVLLGPLTPVEQIGGPANERPYEAAVRVVRAGSGDVVASVRSGADGRFRVNLAPGRYTLIATSRGNGRLPYAPPVDVTVLAHSLVDVTIRFDTGIR
jgi:hypothetical protein